MYHIPACLHYARMPDSACGPVHTCPVTSSERETVIHFGNRKGLCVSVCGGGGWSYIHVNPSKGRERWLARNPAENTVRHALFKLSNCQTSCGACECCENAEGKIPLQDRVIDERYKLRVRRHGCWKADICGVSGVLTRLLHVHKHNSYTTTTNVLGCYNKNLVPRFTYFGVEMIHTYQNKNVYWCSWQPWHSVILWCDSNCQTQLKILVLLPLACRDC